MKKLIALVCLVFPLTLLHAADLLVTDMPYTENGQVQTMKKQGSDEETRIERGEIHSIPYRIAYADGGAVFGNASDPAENWTVSCTKYSSINDVHCPIRKKGLSVYIYASGDNGVSIGPNLYPKSSASITIDGGKPLTTKPGKKGVFDQDTGLAIIRQLSSSSHVSIRYAKWPNKKPIDETINMQGYDEAVGYARWAMKHLKEGKHF